MLLLKFILQLINDRCCFIFMLLFLSGFNSLFAQDKTPNTSTKPIIDSLLSVLKTTHEDTIRVKALNTLAWEEFLLSRAGSKEATNELILKYANDALELAKKLKNKYQQGLAIYTTAALARRDGNYPEALKKYFIVMKLSEEIGDKTCMANQYGNIGDMYSIQGNMSEALNYHLTGLKIFLQTGDKKFIAYAYNRLGNIYSAAGNNEETMKYYLLGLNTAKELDDKKAIGASYISLGNVSKNKGDYTEAMKYFLAALEIYEQTGTNMSECYLGLGYVYFLQALFNKTPSPKQSYSDALGYFQKALQEAKQMQSRWFINEAYLGLAKTYKQLNDYENALEYTVFQNQLKDSLFNKDALNKISALKMQYDLEKARIEEQSRQKVFIAQELATREKLLGEQKLQQEKALAEQKFQQEKQITEEKSKYDKSIALEKASQEKLKADQQRKNMLMMVGAGGVMISSIFLILLLRQRSAKKRAIEKAGSLHKMAELELQSLRAQLNPHFMFNSLNSIQELILLEENEKSHSYLSRFSKLLRMLLDNAEKPFIHLQNEIDFLRLYLSLESLRVPNLQYSISTEPALNTEQTFIPNMILQPYIENAIWHGLSHKETDRQLQVRIFRQNGSVNYEIEDNGVGRKKAAELKSLFRQKHQSKGMELLSKRFKLLNEEYSSEITTNITDVIKNGELAGTLVRIQVPETASKHLQN